MKKITEVEETTNGEVRSVVVLPEETDIYECVFHPYVGSENVYVRLHAVGWTAPRLATTLMWSAGHGTLVIGDDTDTAAYGNAVGSVENENGEKVTFVLAAYGKES